MPGTILLREQLARRKKVALVNLQEQMDKLRQQMLENGDYVVPRPLEVGK